MTLQATISPAQTDIQAAIRAFLLSVVPGLPSATPAVFTGSISGTTLTVAALPEVSPAGISGTIQLLAPVLGAAAGTYVVSQLSGATGGIGTYQVNISQTVATPVTMATGVSVVAGQANKVPEPVNPYFIVMTLVRFERLGTNLHTFEDVSFTGSVAATTLTVTAIAFGTIQIGSMLFGPTVASNTIILAQLSGTTGGVGTYQVSVSQTISSGKLAAGIVVLMQDAICAVQLDFHSAGYLSGDMAQTVSTALRDEYGTSFFATLSTPQNQIRPIDADDPAQRPFVNDSDQWEWRWVVDARLEVNQTIAIDQQFADQLKIARIPVDAFYAP